MAITITGVNHYAISVADLDESIAWYERVFGFTVKSRGVLHATGTGVCHMQGPGVLLEIFCPQDPIPLPDDRRHPNMDNRTLGNKHISFGVPNAHILLGEFEKLGVEVVFIAELPGIYALFICDNTGNLIEIFEEGE